MTLIDFSLDSGFDIRLDDTGDFDTIEGGPVVVQNAMIQSVDEIRGTTPSAFTATELESIRAGIERRVQRQDGVDNARVQITNVGVDSLGVSLTIDGSDEYDYNLTTLQ